MADTNRRKTTRARPSRIPPDGAIRWLPSHLWLWGITAAVVTIDLWSKAWAFRTLGPTDAREHVFGLFTLRRSLNAGALFGLGQGYVLVFIAASVAALGFVLYMFTCSSRRQRAMHVGLAFILAGALGNLYDRITIQAQLVELNGGTRFVKEVVGDPRADPVQLRDWGTDDPPDAIPQNEIASIVTMGVVRDFIKFEPRLLGHEIWPWVFNVADLVLSLGVVILLVHFWTGRRRAPVAAPAVAEIADPAGRSSPDPRTVARSS
jgi:lipoprotein signal peptidase